MKKYLGYNKGISEHKTPHTVQEEFLLGNNMYRERKK
jgi:hypothetical protein